MRFGLDGVEPYVPDSGRPIDSIVVGYTINKKITS